MNIFFKPYSCQPLKPNGDANSIRQSIGACGQKFGNTVKGIETKMKLPANQQYKAEFDNLTKAGKEVFTTISDPKSNTDTTKLKGAYTSNSNSR